MSFNLTLHIREQGALIIKTHSFPSERECDNEQLAELYRLDETGGKLEQAYVYKERTRRGN